MKSRWVKGAFTVVGAIALSTLGIFASDGLQGIDRGIGNLANVNTAEGCPVGSVPLKIDGSILCADQFEASPSPKCPHAELTNAIESEQNANTKDCVAVSVQGATPWNYVSLSQAQRMCSEAGKRLPTSDEWYHIALGTSPEACVIHANVAGKAGTEACVSTSGVYDAVGNVWEWVDENVVGDSFDGRTLPTEGYVASVDAGGVAITSDEQADELYGKDYFWSKKDGVSGMIRGGYYGSGQDAGLFTVNASVPTSFATQGVGFRCVRDIL